jgi:lipopolysaccharide export system permease protein
MKILDRYVGKEVIVTSLFAVTVLSLVLIAGDVFKKLLELLVNRDIPLEDILSFIGYILPYSFTFTIPWGFLTAVVLVFGKMSAENELIALRSNGVSITRICLPLAVIAVALSGLCLWLNVSIAPKAEDAMKKTIVRIATGNPIALFSSDQVISDFPNEKIYVERKAGTALFNVMVYELSPLGLPLKIIHARRGELTTDLKKQQVLMTLTDARFEQRDATAPDDLGKIQQGTIQEGVFPISLAELYKKNSGHASLTQMTVDQLRSVPADDKARMSGARTELSRRFSLSLAAIAFALIGVPLAITAHRKETSVGFLFSLIVAFVYYFFINMTTSLSNKPEFHPELLMWLPNVIFMALGGWLFYRMARR